jgi:hypothetical protein
VAPACFRLSSWSIAAWCVISLMLWACLGMVRPVAAAELSQLSLQRTEEGVFLSSTVQFEPAAAVEEALLRSVPIYFVVQADVLRERWYWADKKVASASRTFRLAYQPLTRRWRVSVASGAGPATSQQYALHQNYDSLAQAIGSVTRVSRWKVADAARVEMGADHYLEFQFKLDLALLPRPFQLGMKSQADWNIEVKRSVPVPEQVSADPLPSGAAGDADVPAGGATLKAP